MKIAPCAPRNLLVIGVIRAVGEIATGNAQLGGSGGENNVKEAAVSVRGDSLRRLRGRGDAGANSRDLWQVASSALLRGNSTRGWLARLKR